MVAAAVFVAFLAALSVVFAGALEAAVEAGALEAVEAGLGGISSSRRVMDVVVNVAMGEYVGTGRLSRADLYGRTRVAVFVSRVASC